MTSQPGKQTILLHTLPKISRSEGNQTMKFGQLIEYNMRNIFFEKSYKMWCRNYSPDSFLKNENDHISGSMVSFSLLIQFIFIVCRFEGYQNILQPSCRPLALALYKAFLKNKKSSRTSPPASSSHDF